jgi:hypothetical protein
MSWDSEFAEPIDLPNNVVATTLRHVIAHIDELPDAEQNSREWQNARKRILHTMQTPPPPFCATCRVNPLSRTDDSGLNRRAVGASSEKSLGWEPPTFPHSSWLNVQTESLKPTEKIAKIISRHWHKGYAKRIAPSARHRRDASRTKH